MVRTGFRRSGGTAGWLTRTGLALLFLLAAANVTLWTRHAWSRGIHNDFASYLTFASLGMEKGWSHLYDWESSRQIATTLGAPYWPNQYPPFTMWIFVPLLALPYAAAYVVWLILMSLALVASWRLLAPTRGRVAYLLVLMAFPPVGFSLWLGQVVPVVILVVAGVCRLLESRRELTAGIVLSGIALKPNLALLTPVVLLAHSRWRAIAALAATGAVMGGLALLLVTPAGLDVYAQHLATVSTAQANDLLSEDLTPAGYLGVGPALLALDAAVVTAVAWISFTTRWSGPSTALAAAIVGSLLVTTYLHWQDLALLLPAGWLWLRQRPGHRFAIAVVAVVWGVCGFEFAVPQVELAWLGIMTYVATREWAVERSATTRVLQPSAG